MAKFIFAAVVLVLGIAANQFLRRRLEGFSPERRPPLAKSLEWGAHLSLILGIGIPALIVITSIFVVIPAGFVGVKVLFGNADPQPLSPGLNIIWNPLYDVQKMDTRVQKFQEAYDTASKDQQVVHVIMALNLRLIPERAPEVYRGIGTN